VIFLLFALVYVLSGSYSLGRSSGNGTFAIQTINLKGIEFEDGFKPTGAPGNAAPQGVVHVASGEHWYCRPSYIQSE
jgi:hypothetical protein